MNRRNFLGNSGKQLAILGLAGLTKVSLSSGTTDNKKKDNTDGKSKDKIIYRTLGKTGISVPVVSMGVMNANNPGLLKGAWDMGIRHFDTAWFYQNGNNEKMVGSVLRDLKVNREDVIVSTKILPQGTGKGKEAKEEFLKRFSESLARLQMDYVDILYYHMPESLEQINDPYMLDAFRELREKKKIRFSGFSTHTDWPALVTDAARQKKYDVILLSFNYSMSNDQRIFDAMKLAHESGIGLIAMKTQCQQDWYKHELPAEIQKFYGESNMNSALLKWALKNEYITTSVPGFTNFDQLKEDIAVAYDLDYSKEEEEFLKNHNVKLAIQSVCRQCGHCIASCPKNADIPDLMRTHMYSLSYGNPLMARQTLEMISKNRGLDACSNCTKCTGKCQFKVPIERRINELKELFC